VNPGVGIRRIHINHYYLGATVLNLVKNRIFGTSWKAYMAEHDSPLSTLDHLLQKNLPIWVVGNESYRHRRSQAARSNRMEVIESSSIIARIPIPMKFGYPNAT